MTRTLKIALVSAVLGFASASSAGPLLHLVAGNTKADLKAIAREAGATRTSSP